MKIKRFLGGGVAGDGGTISCQAELDNGTIFDVGLDGRISTKKAERRIFVGAGYPTAPGARFLERGSAEENGVIAAIQELLGRDKSDEMSLALLKAILER
jgi:hypothetical protein